MITKHEYALLKKIYDNNGRLTFNQQSIFTNKTSFYRAIHNLKERKMVIVSVIPDKRNSRNVCYEIIGKGIELVKILSDDDEY